MKKLNFLHMDIATILIDCAKNATTICYDDLCAKIHYPSLHAIGKELGKLSEFTYEEYGIFISVLVVLKETQNTDNPIPSTGFYTMYADICGETNMAGVAEIQREKAYAQDWSKLPEMIRHTIKN